MRSTAVVHITREDCPWPLPCGAGRLGAPHQVYVASCRDCGWTRTDHLRVILDGPHGLAQEHRRSCPAMAVTA